MRAKYNLSLPPYLLSEIKSYLIIYTDYIRFAYNYHPSYWSIYYNYFNIDLRLINYTKLDNEFFKYLILKEVLVNDNIELMDHDKIFLMENENKMEDFKMLLALRPL